MSCSFLWNTMNKIEFYEKNLAGELTRALGSGGVVSLDGRWGHSTCLSFGHRSSRNTNYHHLYKKVAGFKLLHRRCRSQLILLDLSSLFESKENIVGEMTSLMSHALFKSCEYIPDGESFTSGCFLDFLHPAKSEMRLLYPLGIKMMACLDASVRSHLFKRIARAKTYSQIECLVSNVYDMQRSEDEKY